MVIHVTNRELLRNYKSLKERLLKGQIDGITVSEKDGRMIRLTVERKKTPFEALLEKVRQKPIHIVRPNEDIF